MSDAKRSFQHEHFPDGECFGCGPRNTAGLRIESFATTDDEMICDWTPRGEHSNGAGVLCGGVLGSILDCHAVTAAGQAFIRRDGEVRLAFTKEFTLQFLRPTPLVPLRLTARVTELRTRSALVLATVTVNGEVCVRFEGVFVIPRETAPAAPPRGRSS